MQLLPARRRRGDGGVSPWRDWEALESRMQDLMRRMPLLESASESLGLVPRIDFVEEEGTFILTAELPGVEPGDVEIEIEGNMLSIRGEKRMEREHEAERVQIAERRYGSFERVFALPTSADPDQVSADFHQGVLKVKLPKRQEARGKKIKVEAK